MTKHMIEIEIPDGFEEGSIEYGEVWPTEEGDCIEVTIFLMRIEKEIDIKVDSYERLMELDPKEYECKTVSIIKNPKIWIKER